MRCLIIVLFLAVPFLSIAADLQPGQIWEYKTRTGEAASRLTVLKVEQYKGLGLVVHIREEKK